MAIKGRLKRYRSAFRRYKSSKGFGIHSPFAFRFVLTVLRERCPYYAYAHFEELRHEVISRTRHHLRHPRIISIKSAKLIFRVTNYFNPSHILQIGTSYGVSSVSMLSVSSSSSITLYEAKLGNYPVIHDVYAPYRQRIDVHSTLSDAIAHYRAAITVAEAEVERTREDVAPEQAPLHHRGCDLPFVLINNLNDEAERSEVETYIGTLLATHGVVVMRNLARNQLMLSLWQLIKANASFGMTFSNERIAILVASPKLPRQDYAIWF